MTPADFKRLVLAVGGELFLQGREFGERRIGIDRTVAFARRRAGGVLAGGGAPVSPVTSPLFAAAVAAMLPGRLFAAPPVPVTPSFTAGRLPGVFSAAL